MDYLCEKDIARLEEAISRLVEIDGKNGEIEKSRVQNVINLIQGVISDNNPPIRRALKKILRELEYILRQPLALGLPYEKYPLVDKLENIHRQLEEVLKEL